MKINRQKLLELYQIELNYIFKVCDRKTPLNPKEIVDILSNIIEMTPVLVDRNDECRVCGDHLEPDEQCYCWRDE